MTVWLNGLVAFPVLCLVCDWILRRRDVVPLVVAPVVVGVLWTSHFYTVYMATIGTAIVVVARLLTLDSSWRARVWGAVRCVLAVSLGIGLAAPLLVPTFWAVSAARPSPEVQFRPIAPLEFLARLLPGSEGVGSTPGLAVGTVMLLLAISFPFNRALAVRDRAVWSATVVLTMVSLQVPFTHEAWHGFDTPNGSPYRQAFIVAGLLVIIGWMSASAGLRAVVWPIVAVLALYGTAWHVRTTTTTSHLVVPVVMVVATLTWAVTRRALPIFVRRGAVGVLVAAVLMEVTLSSVAIDVAREKLLSAKGPWDARHAMSRDLVLAADDWPVYRTEPGAQFTVNDPMLIGGQGPQYYSSTMPDAVSRELLGLGFGYSSYGRATIDPANPVVDAMFAVGARVASPDGLRIERPDAGPLVSVRPAKPWSSVDPAPFGLQESAVGADVYSVPEVRGPFTAVPDGLRIVPRQGSEVRVTARCRPGSEVWFAAPTYVGQVFVEGHGWVTNVSTSARSPGVYSGAPMVRVANVGADGVASLRLRAAGTIRLPAQPLGCLDRSRLAAAVQRLHETQPGRVTVGGHSIDIRLTRGVAGVVVIGVIRIDGWRCSVNGRAAAVPRTLAGLIAVPVDAGASSVSCSYRPVGLRTGLAVGAVALLGMLLLLSWRVASARAR
jgi:uncharacterized membrane protein YfhO